MVVSELVRLFRSDTVQIVVVLASVSSLVVYADEPEKGCS